MGQPTLQNQSIFGTTVEFHTQLDLESCRNSLIALKSPIVNATNVGLSQTKIHLISVERKLNKKGEGYHIDFEVEASLAPFFTGWHGHIVSFNGHIVDQENKVRSVSGEIKFDERFITVLAFQMIMFLILPITCSAGIWLTTSNLQVAVFPLGFSLYWFGNTALNLRPIMKSKNQLINTVYEILTIDTPPYLHD